MHVIATLQGVTKRSPLLCRGWVVKRDPLPCKGLVKRRSHGVSLAYPAQGMGSIFATPSWHQVKAVTFSGCAPAPGKCSVFYSPGAGSGCLCRIWPTRSSSALRRGSRGLWLVVGWLCNLPVTCRVRPLAGAVRGVTVPKMGTLKAGLKPVRKSHGLALYMDSGKRRAGIDQWSKGVVCRDQCKHLARFVPIDPL